MAPRIIPALSPSEQAARNALLRRLESIEKEARAAAPVDHREADKRAQNALLALLDTMTR